MERTVKASVLFKIKPQKLCDVAVVLNNKSLFIQKNHILFKVVFPYIDYIICAVGVVNKM